MKLEKLLAMVLALCMVFTLLPGVALAVEADGIEAGTHGELLAALAAVEDGGTITLTATIAGDPININSYEKSFIIDKTTSKYSYPALAGSYTASTNYYTAVGYGVAGVTLTHNNTTAGNVHTFTYTPIDNSTIAAYVSRETIGADSTVYACTDMATALSKIKSKYYIYLHLNQDFTGTASTTQNTAFTLLPEGFVATGTINYNGTSPYEAIMTPIMDTDNIGVSFKYISITVQNGEVTRNFGAAEIAEATAYANDCAGDTTMTIVGSVSISVPAVLDSDVQLAIPNGKTLTLSAPLTVNGMFTNNGTVAFKNSGKLTIPTSATLGTYTVPNANYELTTSTSEDNVTYGISAAANAEVAMLREGDAQPVYYGTLAEALANTKADVVETIRLRKNVTAASAQGIGANVDVIDLNGFTLSTAAGSFFNASRGNVTFRDSSDAKTGKVTGGSSSYGLFNLAYSGNITFESGTFEDTGGLTAVAAFGRAPNGTVISVERDATIASTGYGILIQESGTNTKNSDTTVNIYGKVQGGYAGVYINGNVAISPTPVINIYDGSEVSGIYAAGYGTWNISGGIISNETGIYVKSGELNISGGSISGTGAYAEPAYNGNGFNHTGDAIIIDSCGYPGGAPSVTISDGFFVSSNAYALRHMMTQGATPAQSLLISGGNFTGLEEGSVTSDGPTGFISGGMYDGAPSEALIATGYQYNSSTKHIVPVRGGGHEGGGSSSGGDSGDSGGSTTPPAPPAPPTSPNVGADGAVSQSTITGEAASALSAAPGTTATVRTQGASQINPATLDALAGAGAQAGRQVVLHADTMTGNAVQGRLYVVPAKLTGRTEPLKLGVYTEPARTAATTGLFERFFDNNITTISLEQQGSFGTSLQIAAKVDLSKLDVTALVLYSYDKATNTYRRIENPAYWVDANGYLHFTTELAGDIIISNGPLFLK